MHEPLRLVPPRQPDDGHCLPLPSATLRRWAWGSAVACAVCAVLCGLVAPNPAMWALGLLSAMAAVAGVDIADQAHTRAGVERRLRRAAEEATDARR